MRYAPELAKITDADIARAVAIDDLDAAVASLQAIAQISDGGVAGHCFSDSEFDWGTASAEEREQKIRWWLDTEASYAEESDISEQGAAKGGIAIGSRVKLVKDVENFPTIYAKAGLTGTLVKIDSEGSYWVRLDQHFDELNEWSNKIQIWDYSEQDGPQHSAVSYIALINEVVS